MNHQPSPGQSEPQLLVETCRALPLVSMTVAQCTGSTEDPPGKEGLSRLVARMMRRTAGGLDPQELDTRIDSLGASLSVEAGHSTVGFHATVIARSLGRFVDLLVDVLARPGFAEAEFERLKRTFGADLTFQGGIRTQDVLPYGSPEDVRKEVLRTLDGMAEGGGYILEPGITLQADVPLENLVALIECVVEL